MSGFHPTAIYEPDPAPAPTTAQTPPAADTGAANPIGEHTPDTSTPPPQTTTTQTTSTTPSTTSTTPLTTSTTSTPPPPPPPPKTTSSSTKTQAPPTQGTDTVEVTLTPSLSPSSSAARPTHSPINDTTDDDTTSSKGLIVGGIVAGVIAISVIVFAVWWFRRRKRRNDTEAGAFDASDFRRSAMMLNDPPTHEDVVAKGYGSPRPPSMFQHRMASPAPTFGTQYGAAPPVPSMAYGQDMNSPVSYGVGQTFASPSPYTPYTPNTSAPFLGAGYNAHSYSPAPSEYTADPSYNAYDEKAQDLSRQPSTVSVNYQQQEAGQQYGYGPTVSPNNHSDHVDLSRSSVSPYQAAQYAEISRQLNTEVPQGLNTPAVEYYMQDPSPAATTLAPPVPHKEVEDIKNLPSPFEDPVEAHSSQSNDQEQEQERDSQALHLDFPEPPPNGAAHHWRVDSSPPILPEINVEGGARDSYGFPAPKGQDFPVTPSPLKSTFSHEQESSVGHSGAQSAAPATALTMPVPQATEEKPVGKRPDTVYDPEDVYGGI
jgi:hypothetical protein